MPMPIPRLNAVSILLAVLSAPVAMVSASAQDPLPWQRNSQAANDGYGSGGGYGGDDAYRSGTSPNESYRANGGNGGYGSDDAYRPDSGSGGRYGGRSDSFNDGPPSDPGYGEPYSAPPANAGEPYDPNYGAPPPSRYSGGGYEQSEIIGAGHRFFGSISQGLAGAVEYVFKSQGRPNGYILGEDAGGAIVVGLRYGEGMLYTKDAGNHKVFWQGPSLGYDAGAEGSKTMVLVYNLREPEEIYGRFGGAEGTAYLVGGVSVQFQKYNDVTLAVIRSGVGLRLGANVGYLKYTRAPTWNPL